MIFSWTDERHTEQHDVGLTRDLSVRGAFIFAATLPPSGATLKFKAFLPLSIATSTVRLHGSGQVVRVERGRGQSPVGFAIAAEQRIALRRGEATR